MAHLFIPKMEEGKAAVRRAKPTEYYTDDDGEFRCHLDIVESRGIYQIVTPHTIPDEVLGRMRKIFNRNYDSSDLQIESGKIVQELWQALSEFGAAMGWDKK